MDATPDTSLPPRPALPRRRVPFFFLTAALLLIAWRYFIGFAPSGDDVVYSYIPYQQLVDEALDRGEWPYWNASTFSGRPLLADIQIGFFYPPTWLNRLLPLPLSLTILLIAHAIWGLAGAYRLGRAWALSPPAAALLAILLAFNGFLTSKLQSGVVVFLFTASWLPWSLLALTRLARAPSLSGAAALALTLAMALLAGAPQIAFYSWGAVLFFMFFLPARGEGSAEREPESTGLPPGALAIATLGAFILALALTAVQTYPTAIMARDSFSRGAGASWDYIAHGSMMPRLLALMLQPGLFGPPGDAALYWGELGASEAQYYMTLWAWLLLAPMGLILLTGRGSRLHRRLAIASAVLAGLALMLALGRYFPLFRIFFDRVPGFDRFRVPARMMAGVNLGGAILAALAFEAWLHRGDFPPVRRLAAHAVMLVFTAAGLAALRYLYLARFDLWVGWTHPAFQGGSPGARGEMEALLTPPLLRATVQSMIFLALGMACLSWAGRKPGRALAAWSLPALAAIELALFAWPMQAVAPIAGFRAAHYPSGIPAAEGVPPASPLLAFMMQARANHHFPITGGRVLWLDNVLDYRLAQNQPEVTRNALIMQGMAEARGYDPLNARWIGTWMNRMGGEPPDLDPGGFMWVPDVIDRDYLTLTGVDLVLSYLDHSDELELAYALEPPFDAAGEPWVPRPPFFAGLEPHDYVRAPYAPGRLGIWINPDYRGLAFAAPEGGWQPDRVAAQAAAAEAIRAGRGALEVMRYSPEIQRANYALATADEIDDRFIVRTIQDGPNRFVFETDFPDPAVLYFAQSAYPGWRGSVDGDRVLLAYANGTFLAIAVQEGAHRVVFEYAPPHRYFALRALSLATLFAVLLALVLGAAWRRLGPTGAMPAA